MATVSFGHGIATTLLQIAKGYSIISNGGFLVEPKVVKGENIIKKERVLDSGLSEKINPVLRKVVSTDDGTAGFANVYGYEIGGTFCLTINKIMKYDITQALNSLKPGAEWVLRGNDYSGLEWLDSSQTKPTETEVNSKISELDNAEAMRLLRIERDTRIAKTDWRASSDLTLADAWKTYRQALRDLPASATPKLNSDYELDLTSVTWPTEPS